MSLFASCQWIIGELACYTYSMVAVPLYDTLGPEALVFIINQGNWSSFPHHAANESGAGSGSLWERPLITFHLFVAPAPFICASFCPYLLISGQIIGLGRAKSGRRVS